MLHGRVLSGGVETPASRVELDPARFALWAKTGAQLTDKVRDLYKDAVKAQASA